MRGWRNGNTKRVSRNTHWQDALACNGCGRRFKLTDLYVEITAKDVRGDLLTRPYHVGKCAKKVRMML